jgi:hypothetical protein
MLPALVEAEAGCKRDCRDLRSNGVENKLTGQEEGVSRDMLLLLTKEVVFPIRIFDDIKECCRIGKVIVNKEMGIDMFLDRVLENNSAVEYVLIRLQIFSHIYLRRLSVTQNTQF